MGPEMSAATTLKIIKEIATDEQSFSLKSNALQRILDIFEAETGFEYLAILSNLGDKNDMEPCALSKQNQGADFLAEDFAYVISMLSGNKKGITQWVAHAGQSARVANVADDPRYFGIRGHIRSELCLPIVIDNHVVGVVNTETKRANAYKQYDESFTSKVASIIAPLVNYHRLQKICAGYGKFKKEAYPLVIVCAWCTRIDAGQGFWASAQITPAALEDYRISHGLCPDCRNQLLSR